jgi:hypothetical protein
MFQVLKAMSMKMGVLQDAAPCSTVDTDRRFTGIYCRATPMMEAIITSETVINMYRLSRTTVNLAAQHSVWLRAGQPGDRGSIPGRGERIFPLDSVSRPALGSTQPPVQWVLGVLPPGLKNGQGVTLTTHPHLLPRSRMSGSYISSPPKRFRGV